MFLSATVWPDYGSGGATGCRWSLGGGLSRPEPGRLARRGRSRERSMLGSEIETPIVDRRRVVSRSEALGAVDATDPLPKIEVSGASWASRCAAARPRSGRGSRGWSAGGRAVGNRFEEPLADHTSAAPTMTAAPTSAAESGAPTQLRRLSRREDDAVRSRREAAFRLKQCPDGIPPRDLGSRWRSEVRFASSTTLALLDQ
jgi:hypothetical protein